MKKYILLFISVAYLSGFAFPQESRLAQSTDPYSYLENLLQPGFYTAELMTGSENKERFNELSGKMLAHVQDDYDWYVEFVRQSANGYPEKYDKRLGLTTEEFEELRTLIDDYKMASTETFTIEIVRKGRHIQFFCTGNSAGSISNVKIDLQSQKITYLNHTMSVTDTLMVDYADNRMGTRWEGLQWSYLNPPHLTMDNISELMATEKEIQLFRVTVGELLPSGRLYLSLKGVELSDGMPAFSYTYPLFLTKR